MEKNTNMTRMLFAVLTVLWLPVKAGQMQVAFSDYDGEAALTDFPALVVLSEDTAGFSYSGFSSPHGYDLRFSNSTDTVELAYEIESWNPEGKSYVWVNIPEFTSNTVINAYWGGDATQPATCTDGTVWPAPCRAVWHFSDLKDSTSNGVHALPTSTATEAKGVIGAARETGDGQWINLGTVPALNVTNTFTFSFWMRTASAATRSSYIYSWRNVSASFGYSIICGYKANAVEFYQSDGGVTGTDPRPYSDITVPDAYWHHYAYTYDGTTFARYRDGALIGATNITFAIKIGPAPTAALGSTVFSGNFFLGQLDEFRIMDQACPADWIYAAYLNLCPALIQDLDIRFPEYDRNETLTNFPALVALNERLPGFSYDMFRSAQGNDLRFSDPAGTVTFNHEIETWDPAGTSYVWVQIPAFTSNCAVRATWGDVSHADAPPPYATNGAAWSDGFQGVWHCNPVKIDSSPYGAQTTGPSGDYLRGPVGNHALPCGIAAARILAANTGQISVSNAFTFSFWAKVAGTGQQYVFYAPPSGGQIAVIYGYAAVNKDTFEFYAASGFTGADPRPGSEITAPDAEWHHYAYAYDGSVWAGYRDGGQVFTVTRAFELKPVNLGSGALRIGGADSGQFIGMLDEFRIEDQGRSADWFYACWRNQQTRRGGVDYLNVPTFGGRGAATATGSGTATVTGELSCRLPCSVTLYCGADDIGEKVEGWGYTEALGTWNAGTVAANLAGLDPDRNYVYRFYAESETGACWSEPFAFRTAPDLSQYQCRMPITFSGYVETETLTNFPALIVLSERLAGFSYSQFAPDGDDLRFTDTAGAPLDHEIETWDPAGDSFVWVRIPELTQGLTIWAYWRSKGVFDTPVPAVSSAVWDDAFRAVYHLSPVLTDSTRHANHLADTTTTNDAGRVGPARGFNGAARLQPRVSGVPSVSGAFTYSLWLKQPSPGSAYLYGRDTGESVTQHAIAVDASPHRIRFFAGSHLRNPVLNDYAAMNIPDDDWHQYVFSYDGSSFTAYRDGEQLYDLAAFLRLHLTDGLYPGIRCRLGAAQGSGNFLVGALDEFRLESVGRSQNWIRANYLAQSTPETFCTSGSVRTGNGTVIMLR